MQRRSSKRRETGRPSPEAQAEFARRAIRRTYTINPGTRVVPSKRRQERPKHRADWRAED